MKTSFRVILSVLVTVLLNDATGLAQPRTGEFGRGFPYSSGGEWSWGPFIFVLVLLLVLGLAGVVKDKLEDQPWWHTLIVVVATLLSTLALTVKVSQPYPAQIGLAVFMLIPSFACIALLYLTIIRLFRRGE